MAAHPELLKKLNAMLAERSPPSYAAGLDTLPAAAEMLDPAAHLDAWQNGLTGIGTDRDKVTATTYQPADYLLPTQLEDLYHNDDVAARICDLIPETAMRELPRLSDEKLQRDLEAMGAWDKFESAWTFGRLHGGGPILLGGPGNSSEPLTRGATSMLTLDRWTLWVYQYETDYRSPKYGYPKFYRLSRPIYQAPGGPAVDIPDPAELIHESRLVIFPGARTSPRRKLFRGWWDDSVLQRVYGIIQAYGLTWASVIHLLQDAAQGVYKMKDLWNMIIGGNKSVVEDRMKMVDEQRSSARMILTDADNEDFKRVPTPFTGIPELIDRMSERLASATGYPLTVLMGSSPAGMNATGKSDLEIYYGRVESQRRKVLTPAIRKAAAAMGADISKLTIHYPPLWVQTQKETADTRYATAQADNIYAALGLPADVILKSRFRDSGWSSETELPPDFKPEPKEPAPPVPAPGVQPSGVGQSKQSIEPPGGVTAGSGSPLAGTHHYSPLYGR